MDVDIASMLADSAVRVGRWIQTQLDSSERILVLYEAACVAVQHPCHSK